MSLLTLYDTFKLSFFVLLINLFLDTAKVYRNESIIGEIMANLGSYGLKREDLFLTTKLSNDVVIL